ncbi:MAG: hypothetical protein NXI04_17570 [Planctomycetaceae bacterium]|nr:hypothetical protein [Planctomycetaceae bacterium]
MLIIPSLCSRTRLLQLAAAVLVASGSLAPAQYLKLRDADDAGPWKAAYQKISAAAVPVRAAWRLNGETQYSYTTGVRLQSATPGKCLLLTKGLTFRQDMANTSQGGYSRDLSMWIGTPEDDQRVLRNWKPIRPVADSMAAGTTFFLVDCEDGDSLPVLSGRIPREDLPLAIISQLIDREPGRESVVRLPGGEALDLSTLSRSRVGKSMWGNHANFFSCDLKAEWDDPDLVRFVFDQQGDLLGVATGSTQYGLMAGMIGATNTGTSTFLWVADMAESLKEHGGLVEDTLIAAGIKRRIEQADKYGRPVVSTGVTVTWSDDHQELQALSAMTGRWSNVKIPREDLIVPVVGTAVAAVQLQSSVAAYSAESGTWDLLDVGRDEEPIVTVDTSAVKVNFKDSSRMYFFPLKTGVWTSPNDPDYREKEVVVSTTGVPTSAFAEAASNRVSMQTNRGGVQIRGIARHVDAAVRMIEAARVSQAGHEGLAIGESQSAGGSPDVRLALQLRSAGKTVGPQDRAKLQSVVESLLQERLDHQKKMAQQLEAKLRQIEKTLAQREANRELIVSRRVEELLNPDVDWESLMGGSGETGRPAGSPKSGGASLRQPPQGVPPSLFQRQ